MIAIAVHLLGGQSLKLELPDDDYRALIDQVGHRGAIMIDHDGSVHTTFLAEHINAIEVREF